MKSTFQRLTLPAAISLAMADPALAVQYSIQALAIANNTSGASSYPYVYGLNKNGKAVGSRSFTASNPNSSGLSAVLYDQGVTQDLVPLAPNLSLGIPRNQHYAYAINDSDQVVGSYTPADPNYYTTPPRAFLYDGTTVTNLGTLGGTYSSAYDINGAGQIVGSADNASQQTRPVLFERDANGTVTVKDLEAATSSFTGVARGINNSGQIVGAKRFALGGCYQSSNWKAFLYDNGIMTNLGTLASGCTSMATAINDKGQIVGWSDTSFIYSQHAFFYENGQMTDLGTLGGNLSYAWDLNNNGRAVGWAGTSSEPSHAFLYANGKMLDLNNLLPSNSGWLLENAMSINDKEQIVGEGTINGVHAVYLLTPVYPVANAGLDITVHEADAVTLNGSGSSAPGCATVTGTPCPVYVWSQLSGEPVTLDQTYPATPTFTAPTLPVGKKTDVLTFNLVVKDDMFASSPAVVNVTVQHVNLPPVANAGDSQTVNEESLVTLNGTGSFDPDGVTTDGNYLTYAWTNPATTGPCASIELSSASAATPGFTAPSVGASGVSCAFELVVTDADGASSPPATTTVTIENVNHPPVANAGTDQTVTEGDAPVTLNGSASSDPDGDPLSYSWTQLSGTAVTLNGSSSATPSFTAPEVGPANDTLSFQLTVDDGLGGTGSDQVDVTVLDKSAPPACAQGKIKADDLWPPNHKMKKVELEGLGEDRERVVSGAKHSASERDDVFVRILAVTQDEPVLGVGDDDMGPDATVTADDDHDTLLVRAERAGGGNGRVYQIRYDAVDKQGQHCEGVVKICVPPSKGKHASCVDDGQLYDSLSR